MLNGFYLDFISHVQTNKVPLDVVSKKYEIWKEDQMQKTREINDRITNYNSTILQAQTDYDTYYKQEYLDKIKEFKSHFKKSSISKRQAALDEWINYHNEKIVEFDQMEKPTIYTSKYKEYSIQ
jgi:hypothetical protein